MEIPQNNLIFKKHDLYVFSYSKHLEWGGT